MRTLLHLSDLHFGRIEPDVLEPLMGAAHQVRPDLIVVSGDLTQRARPSEFKAARAFLDSLPFAKLIVPGNHDVPTYNVAARFLWPMQRYRDYISIETEPLHQDDEMIVLGLNSARSLTVKSGRIRMRQIERAQRVFCTLPEEMVKIVAAHHPFDLPGSCGTERVVGGAARAVRALAACGADLCLAGHFHVSHTACSIERYRGAGSSILLVAAGTATSTRRRGEANAFNVVKLEAARISVIPHTWTAGASGFTAMPPHHYVRGDKGWEPVGPQPAATPVVVTAEA